MRERPEPSGAWSRCPAGERDDRGWRSVGRSRLRRSRTSAQSTRSGAGFATDKAGADPDDLRVGHGEDGPMTYAVRWRVNERLRLLGPARAGQRRCRCSRARGPAGATRIVSCATRSSRRSLSNAPPRSEPRSRCWCWRRTPTIESRSSPSTAWAHFTSLPSRSRAHVVNPQLESVEARMPTCRPADAASQRQSGGATMRAVRRLDPMQGSVRLLPGPIRPPGRASRRLRAGGRGSAHHPGRRAHAVEAIQADKRLRSLVEAGLALTSELSLDAVLQRLVETAAELTGRPLRGARRHRPGGLAARALRHHGIDAETRGRDRRAAPGPRHPRRALIQRRAARCASTT